MGIKGLSAFLRKEYPQLFESIHISQYHHQRIAIDTSLFMCQYKANYGNEGWLSAFIKLVALLRENEVHCVFIYDSGYPPEKEAEKKQRMQSRQKMEERVTKLESVIEKYHITAEVDPLLFEFQNKRKITSPSLLRDKNGLGRTININAIEYDVKKMRKQLFNITAQDYEMTKKLFDILDIPYFNAPMEAETMCADLCIQGKVDAVLTEDTDVLAYGSHVFLTKFNPSDGTCTRIKYPDVLDTMGLNAESFLDFCIMCGTDYNKNINLIGPVKALKLITVHGTIDEISKTGVDVRVLNHVRGRELFRGYEKTKIRVPYCGTPNFTELQVFIAKRNIRTSIDSLRKSFVKADIVFENDIVVEQEFVEQEFVEQDVVIVEE
jgi:5'-3' exonuclease